METSRQLMPTIRYREAGERARPKGIRTLIQAPQQRERKIEMKAIVDKDLCIACGICEGIVPEVFSLQNEPYAEVLLDPIPEEFQDAVREAAEECSEAAITIE